jgi:hypothetical protein
MLILKPNETSYEIDWETVKNIEQYLNILSIHFKNLNTLKIRK